MNDAGPSAPPRPFAEPPRASGRRVLLYLIFGIPAVLVPLLLAGRSVDRDVDLRTLMQRERTAYRVGSFDLVRFEDRLIDQWPLQEAHPYVRDELLAPARATPSAFATEALGQLPEPRWMPTFRGMPFAVVTRIDNPRVLGEHARAVVELRLVAASILDPADSADRALLVRLDAMLSDTTYVTGDEPAPRKRRRASYTPPTRGEAAAKRLLDAILELPAGPERRDAARQILAHGVEAVPTSGEATVTAAGLVPPAPRAS